MSEELRSIPAGPRKLWASWSNLDTEERGQFRERNSKARTISVLARKINTMATAETIGVIDRRGEVLYSGGIGPLYMPHGNPDGSGDEPLEIDGRIAECLPWNAAEQLWQTVPQLFVHL